MRYILIMVLVPYVLSSIAPAVAFADRQNEHVILQKDEVVLKDYFAAGESVTISGTVKGDAYVAGGRVLVEGVIEGDLIATGGIIELLGRVGDDVRVMGGQVIISGTVGGSFTAVAGSVSLTNTASVGGSFVAGAGAVSLFAPVGGDVAVGAGALTIGGPVGGDVRAGAGKLTLSPSAAVSGSLTYCSEEEATLQPGATVGGEVIRKLPPAVGAGVAIAMGIATGLAFFVLLSQLVSGLVLGLLLIRVFPGYMERTVGQIQGKPLITLGIGFATLVLVPSVAALLSFTGLGIPLAVLLILYLLIISFFAYMIASLFIGQQIMRTFGRTGTDGWALLVGLVAFGILSLIPIAGAIICLVLVFMGTGALLVQKQTYLAALRARGEI